MHHRLSKEARTELLQALRERYHHATRAEKTLILDEVVALADCRRKHAVRLLADPRAPPRLPPRWTGASTTRQSVRRSLSSGKLPIACVAKD